MNIDCILLNNDESLLYVVSDNIEIFSMKNIENISKKGSVSLVNKEDKRSNDIYRMNLNSDSAYSYISAGI